MDQETLAYGQWQKDNRAANIWAEANLQNFYTDTQWLPRLDYYRLGDSFFKGVVDPLPTHRSRLRQHAHRHHGEQPQPVPVEPGSRPSSPSCPTTRSRTPAACSRRAASTPVTSSRRRSTSTTWSGSSPTFKVSSSAGPTRSAPGLTCSRARGDDGPVLGRRRPPRRDDRVEALPQRRERAVQHPRAQQQDHLLRQTTATPTRTSGSRPSPSRTTLTTTRTSSSAAISRSPTGPAASCR